MSIRLEQARQTRTALLSAARELFLVRGYGAVSMEEIVARAGVTRGALYHHFDGKPAVFEAVFEEIDTELLAVLRAAVADTPDPYEAVFIATKMCFDSCLDPHLARLVLLDAPTVLGWCRWREIQLRHALGLIVESITACMAAGQMREQPVAPLSHMYFATVMEMGMFIANAADPVATRVQCESVLNDWMRSLRVSD